ncbi:carboxylesterase family protein [Chelatococcus sambhunathii]|uniref:Carboxylic ester hydrolase n=1 Tax=Chelatococcus sambhunathii TaxID=363953 RepID=A0ABU1DJW0_9HYPH|nr:carboxylesterase family protein [Chelatococcus sambhunathii]MDR4308412.1 carboxylesterase family protein [Chelatococcus sambhunathii]
MTRSLWLRTLAQPGRSAVLAAILGAGAMLASSSPSVAAAPKVSTDKGVVIGFVEDGVARFYGIPYAKPPIGKLRWRPPVEPEAWKKPLQATKFGPQCLQVTTLGPFAGPQNTNEDCLYLNVYAPQSAIGGGRKLPVIVWIHGGGNVDGASDAYDGSKMATDGKTIVVTLNYRLNLMGFFAHPAINAEGHLFANYGVMDQQAVLKWVQANIGKFGGDAGNVTLGGQSAGASDTMANMTSPLAKGLFHRAILQSGVGSTTPLATAETNAKNMSVAAGCGSGTDEDTAKCLRKLPAEKIFDLAGTQSANGPYISGLIEDGQIIQRRFVDTIASGDFNKMPVMSGATIDEAMFSLGITQYFREGRTPLTKADYDARIATYGGPTFPENAQERVKKLYPLSAYESPLLALDAIQTDTTQCTQHNTNVLLSGQVPVYAYQFADRTAPTYFPKMEGYLSLAYHTADIQYLFIGWHGGNEGIPHDLNKKQRKLSDELVEAWTNFAWSGNPNGSGDSPWPRFKNKKNLPGILEQNIPFSTAITDAAFTAEHKCQLWDSILSYHPLKTATN